MHLVAGFFPPTPLALSRFSEQVLKEIEMVDVLGSWIPAEKQISHLFSPSIQLIEREVMNPFFADDPWTLALENRKILIIHPFEETIRSQYAQRDRLFTKKILPDFELSTLKAVQSSAKTKTTHSDWFAALNHMQKQMEEIDFDIALIGAGAYGFSLAAHAKRLGKTGIHIGGSLQLFFGIKGTRWEDSNYSPKYNYAQLMNEHWVKPSTPETPKNVSLVEDSCYW